MNKGKLADNAISVASLAVVKLPEFVTGIILIQILAFRFGLPDHSFEFSESAGFFEALPSLILPALTATFVLLGLCCSLDPRRGDRRTQTALRAHRGAERLAASSGYLAPCVARRAATDHHCDHDQHQLVISGLVVIENVFNSPGLGRLMVFAISRETCRFCKPSA